jgi:glycosyltransferase involved in cell wall biosynthesis
MPTISYALSACNEYVELDRLLEQLTKHIRPEDEIVVQIDLMNVTEQVMIVLAKYHDKINNPISFDLNNDFAAFKNNLKENCSKDYIFQIDADEYLSDQLIENIHQILELNPTIEVYAIPRVNTVEGLTPEHIQKWGWNVNVDGWVNYPDYQTRILKNIPEIKWVNRVHERLVGSKINIALPGGYDIIHPKTIERQEKQNNFYDTL